MWSVSALKEALAILIAVGLKARISRPQPPAARVLIEPYIVSQGTKPKQIMHQLPSVSAQGIAHQISGKNDSCHGLTLYLTDEFSSTSAGTVLIRDWQGKSHHVTVLGRGTRGLGGGARGIRTRGTDSIGRASCRE